jgi:hypothetical protein
MKEQIEHALHKADVFSTIAAINSMTFVSQQIPSFFSHRRSFKMKKFAPTAVASKCNESNGNWKRKNEGKKDNKFSCMIHWISLNACHFMAQHKVQQDLWELIFFFSSLLCVFIGLKFQRVCSSSSSETCVSENCIQH